MGRLQSFHHDYHLFDFLYYSAEFIMLSAMNQFQYLESILAYIKTIEKFVRFLIINNLDI